MDCKADAVSQTVAEVLTEACIGDKVPRHSIHLCSGHARTDGLFRSGLRSQHGIIDFPEPVV